MFDVVWSALLLAAIDFESAKVRHFSETRNGYAQKSTKAAPKLHLVHSGEVSGLAHHGVFWLPATYRLLQASSHTLSIDT